MGGLLLFYHVLPTLVKWYSSKIVHENVKALHPNAKSRAPARKTEPGQLTPKTAKNCSNPRPKKGENSHTYIYIYIHNHMCIYIYVHIYAYTHIYIYYIIYTCVCACVCECARVCVCVCVCVMYVYIYIYTTSFNGIFFGAYKPTKRVNICNYEQPEGNEQFGRHSHSFTLLSEHLNVIWVISHIEHGHL